MGKYIITLFSILLISNQGHSSFVDVDGFFEISSFACSLSLNIEGTIKKNAESRLIYAKTMGLAKQFYLNANPHLDFVKEGKGLKLFKQAKNHNTFNEVGDIVGLECVKQ